MALARGLLGPYAVALGGLNRDKAANAMGILTNRSMAEALMELAPNLNATHLAIRNMLMSKGVLLQHRLVAETVAVHGFQNHLRRLKSNPTRWWQAVRTLNERDRASLKALLDKAVAFPWAHDAAAQGQRAPVKCQGSSEALVPLQDGGDCVTPREGRGDGESLQGDESVWPRDSGERSAPCEGDGATSPVISRGLEQDGGGDCVTSRHSGEHGVVDFVKPRSLATSSSADEVLSRFGAAASRHGGLRRVEESQVEAIRSSIHTMFLAGTPERSTSTQEIDLITPVKRELASSPIAEATAKAKATATPKAEAEAKAKGSSSQAEPKAKAKGITSKAEAKAKAKATPKAKANAKEKALATSEPKVMTKAQAKEKGKVKAVEVPSPKAKARVKRESKVKEGPAISKRPARESSVHPKHEPKSKPPQPEPKGSPSAKSEPSCSHVASRVTVSALRPLKRPVSADITRVWTEHHRTNQKYGVRVMLATGQRTQVRQFDSPRRAEALRAFIAAASIQRT